MSYYFSKTLKADFEATISKTIDELKKEGFGVLTEIDVKSTLKKKIGVDFPKYMILGACNPHFAHKALLVESHIGTMLPCNVIVRELDSGEVEVSAVDPIESMKAIKNPSLSEIATVVRSKLQNVIENI